MDETNRFVFWGLFYFGLEPANDVAFCANCYKIRTTLVYDSDQSYTYTHAHMYKSVCAVGVMGTIVGRGALHTNQTGQEVIGQVNANVC